MSLTSPAFAAFALAVLLAAWLAGRRFRLAVLLFASYAFYASCSPYLPAVLGAVTLISFWGGLVLERETEPSGRRALALWAGASAAAGSLLVLKYTGFLGSIVDGVAAILGGRPAVPVLNPFVHIGVSYWALQVIAYLLDVSQGVVPAERHLGRYALYVAFFPKMLQGPIERPGRFLPQLDDPPPLRAADVAAALPLVLWGVFQKVVVADRLAPFVDNAFGDPSRYQGLSTFVATYLFAAQIYFDFGGYTCVAIGVGRALGFRLSPNFDAPYSAGSVPEFWRRWHISFSSWILDYVFRPSQLALRRWRTFGTPAALLVTFGFSGLWHGATWGFVAWGLLHGVYLSSSVLFAGIRKRAAEALGLARSSLHRPLQVFLTFQLVCIAWVFFRAATARQGASMLVGALACFPASLAALARGEARHVLFLDLAPGRLAFVLALVCVATILPRFLPELRTHGQEPRRDGEPWHTPWVRAVAYSALFYMIAFLGGTTQAFIYARF